MLHISCMTGPVVVNDMLKRDVIFQKPVVEVDGVNTTLQAFFFGRNGEGKLQYQEFQR